MLTVLLPWLTFLAIGLTIFCFGQVVLGSRRSAGELAGETIDREPVFGRLTTIFAALLPVSQRTRQAITRELRQAGHYQPLALVEFLAIRNVLLVGWVLVTGAAVVAAVRPINDPTVKLLLVGAMVLVMLYAAPRLCLQSAAAKRVRSLQTGLPDALDLVTLCLSGGLPLGQALKRVGGELKSVHPELAMELEIIRRQSEAYTLEHALAQFSDRTDAPEIRMLAAIVAQTERLGTNVGGALREFADGLRRNHRQRAEERGNKASVKLMLPVVLCLAPPVYILLLAPALLELREFMVRENRTGGILAPDTNIASPLEAARRSAATDGR